MYINIFKKSIFILCNHGQRYDANILLRSLFENYIHTKYIIKNKKGKQFLDYGDYSNNKSPDGDYPNIQSQFSNKCFRRFGWSGKTLRDLAKDIEEENKYIDIEKSLSPNVHCDPFVMVNFIQYGEKETIFDEQPTMEGIEQILERSVTFFAKIVVEWAKLFDAEIPDAYRRYI